MGHQIIVEGLAGAVDKATGVGQHHQLLAVGICPILQGLQVLQISVLIIM